MHFHIITIFPEICKAYTDASILGRAQKAKKIQISYYNPRDYTLDTHKKVDDRPYGGGPGMVMHAEPILKAVEKAIGKKKNVGVFILSPRGGEFTQKYAQRLSTDCKHIVLICGRYEGIDERVKDILHAKEISIGPYTLTGGELPALTMVDAIARCVKGVLGSEESLETVRKTNGKMYTRPAELVWKKKKYSVPKVLQEGNHKEIDSWRA